MHIVCFFVVVVLRNPPDATPCFVTFYSSFPLDQVNPDSVAQCDPRAYLHGRLFSLMHMKQRASVPWTCPRPGSDARRSERLIKKRT